MTIIQTALLSVTDKTGIVDFGKELQGLEVEILSTGGTAKTLRDGGVKVVEVSDYTGFPECFDDRVKTLHPKVAGGILFERDKEAHRKQAAELGVKKLDLVVVNLYKFEEVAAKPGVTIEELIKNMDVGGPAMLKEAVKNNNDVVVVTDPRMYEKIIRELRELGEISTVTRKRFAADAMNRVADYESAIAVALTKALTGEETVRLVGRNGKPLDRYGENWDQKAWLFPMTPTEPNVANGEKLHGKAPGYNNLLDADSALSTAQEFVDFKLIGKILKVYDAPTVVVVKHTNPCGLASATKLEDALEMAWQGDIVSAFGSIIAFNREVDLNMMKVLCDRFGSFDKEREKYLKGYFVEVLVAPSYTKDALEYLKGMTSQSKKDMRVFAVGDLNQPQAAFDYRFIRDGILRQTRNKNNYLTSLDDCFTQQHTVRCENSGADRVVGIVTQSAPEESMKGLYDFTWKAVKRVKSNAIAIAREYAPGQYQLLGIGAGQMNRVESTRLAIKHAEETLRLEYLVAGGKGDPIQKGFFTNSMERLKKLGIVHSEGEYKEAEAGYVSSVLSKCVCASDAFFPFPDGPELLMAAGVRNVIQPGGGKIDQATIDVVNKYNGAMVLTGKRNFLH